MKFFASYREKINSASLDIDISVGFTVKDLIDEIAKMYPILTKDFSSLLVAVNWEYSDFDLVLHENDEVALIPPVSGGLY